MCPSHVFKAARSIDGRPGKWCELGIIPIEEIDHYTIRPCELVFDIDFRQWRYAKSVALKIVSELQLNWGVIPATYHTGGKGVHIHFRFDISPHDDLGFYDYFRQELAVKILKQTGLLAYYGRGRPIDAAPIKFSSAHAGHMIRAPGGRHKRGYKSLIDAWRDKPPRLREDVVIEEFYPRFDFSQVALIVKPKYRKAKVTREESHVDIPLEFMLPCVQRIIKGPIVRGSRNSAAKALAISASRSGASERDFMRWAMKMSKNFENRESFEMREAMSWYEWAQNNRAEWWCEDVRHVRVRGREVCAPRCPYRKRG